MKLFITYILQIHIFLIQFQNYECGISASKCREYGEAVYIEKETPVLTMDLKKSKESECGISSIPLIIGGTRAADKEFPHIAILGFGSSPSDNLEWLCGGSLVSDLFVLTAAHCLHSRTVGPAQKVKLGMINLNESDPEQQERTIVKKFPHPKYNLLTKHHDIALIELDEPVEFTASVRPSCLNTEEIKPGRKAIASGFGKLQFESSSGSRNLMKVTLNIYDNDKCSHILRGVRSDSIICAGDLKGGKDTCQGDSGGPLQIVLEDPYCMYSIIGVTSFGKFCGFANSPAIYSKVSYYVPWIESIVWKKSELE